MSYFNSINPYTSQTIEEHAWHSKSEVDSKIDKADKAFRYWKNLKVSERGAFLSKLAAVLQKNKAAYALIITSEMGKPITEALAEVEKCANTCQYFAVHAEALSQDQLVQTEARKSYVAFQPLGVILGIMPWNFPFWQVIRFAIPTLAAGNTVLLKHAPNVIGCVKAIEGAFVEAGFEEGVFQSLVIDTPAVEHILQDKRVKGVSVTGSERAGRAVAAIAGANIKKSVMELGGNDAFIVLKDADIAKAAEIGLQSRMQNAGQVCICAKRFIVEKSVKEAFVDQLLKHLSDWKPADPTLPTTKMGPMARLDLAENIEKQFRDTLRQGAVALTDFYRDHCMVQPIILDQVQHGTVAFCEETFGPLAAIITAKDEQEAIALANDSRFGLGATIFTQDLAKGEQLALQIEAGMVFVNAQVKSDPRFPIGGINNSGYGRELSSFGMHEFVNAKTVYVA